MYRKSIMVNQIQISTFFLAIWMSLAFLSNILIHTISAGSFAVIVLIVSVIFVLLRNRWLKSVRGVDLMILLALCFVLLGYYHAPQSATLIDIFVLFSGILVLRCSIDSEQFISPIRLMTLFGLFFSFSVILNFFLPSIYSSLLSVFPSGFANAIREGTGEGYYQGFTTNPGQAAGFIVAALIAQMAQWDQSYKKTKRWIVPLIMFIGLLLTGKRAHMLFFLIAIILCYLLPVRGQAKIRRYWRLFVTLVIVIIGVAMFWDVLMLIPAVARLADTVAGVVAGEDISNARSGLYVWAWKIFLENPFDGIGWNIFRSTTAGTATLMTSMDTHNIYLQLLCENGIAGFLCFASFFVICWTCAKNSYKQCLNEGIESSQGWFVALKFSFMFQTFFLLYGLTGNPLYDQSYQILYMFSCAICLSYRFIRMREKDFIKTNVDQNKINIKGGFNR